MPKDETGDAAFTLVEVMVSVVLMLLALRMRATSKPSA